MSTSRKRRSTVVPVDQQAESTQAVGTREMSTRASKRRKVTISTTTEHEEANESVKTGKTSVHLYYYSNFHFFLIDFSFL